MVQVDSAGPSTGAILLSADKRRLVWDIGQFATAATFMGLNSKWKAYSMLPSSLVVLCTSINNNLVVNLSRSEISFEDS